MRESVALLEESVCCIIWDTGKRPGSAHSTNTLVLDSTTSGTVRNEHLPFKSANYKCFYMAV